VNTRTAPVSVLLVEDSIAEAELVRDELEFARRPGFEIRHAVRLSHAVELLAQRDAEVIVLDLGLPDARGLQAVTRLRAAAPAAAIVVRSGLADEEVALQALEAGVHDYLLKGERGATSALERSILFALARRQAEESARARQRAEAMFEAAFEHSPIGVAISWLRGPDRGRIVRANAAYTGMLGREPGELDGVAVASLRHPDDPPLMDVAYEQLARGERVETEKRYVHRDGRTIWALLSATALPAEDGGEPTHCVAQVLDISERKRFEGQLRYLADHDALTGLFNRHRFEQELDRVTSEVRRYGRRGALMVLDLDGFKIVNDRFGHPLGDELVRRVSGLLRQSVRETDIVARIGGDEFAVLLLECDRDQAVRVARKILDTIRRRGVVLDDEHRATVTTSIGITLFDGSCALTGPELVVEADIAMYDAKAEGRDRFSIYDRTANRRELISQRHSWLERLRTAIDEDLFELLAQPIVGICANGIRRYELLLRMRDDQGDLIPPGAFLYNAERFDLMGEIDRWVLRKAVSLLHAHHAAGNDISLSVNLSGKTMNDLRLPADLAEMLEAQPVPAGRLVVEVTETAAIVNIERARELAKELRKLGCEFALDDFGAGFASFYYLKHLEFDYLKIDGEFIKKLVSTHSDQLVVQAVVDIARGLGTKTVAEFVGDGDTAKLLHSFGVDYGQGYHLGRPGPLDLQLPALRRTAASSAKTGGR
jgi:diguanylate cyclase (GGDEF)-like protein/PAS domain S-box-containing protein